MSEHGTEEVRQPVKTDLKGKISSGKVHFPCDFCGKYDDHEDVEHLIQGPAAGICNECIDTCVEIIAEKKAEPFYDLRNAP
jgi:ClpX C4-type zinc finger